MTRQMMFLGMVACLLLVASGQRLLSQGMRSGGPPTRGEFERMQDMSPKQRSKYLRKSQEDRFRQFRRMAEEQEVEAMKQALGVDENQWRVIEPKLKKARACRNEAFVGIGLPFQSSFTGSVAPAPGRAPNQGFGGGWAGGFQYQGSAGGGTVVHSSSVPEDFDRPPSEGERVCAELQRLLQEPDERPDEIRRNIDALRKARGKARKQWALAQQELREVLNLRQEATLVTMGLLE